MCKVLSLYVYTLFSIFFFLNAFFRRRDIAQSNGAKGTKFIPISFVDYILLFTFRFEDSNLRNDRNINRNRRSKNKAKGAARIRSFVSAPLECGMFTRNVSNRISKVLYVI